MIDKIKTFEDACGVLNLDPTALPDFSMLPEKHRKALLAHTKLVIIAEALNDGWKPDWTNYDEPKYTPWFEAKEDEQGNPSAFGFSFTYCDFWCTDAGCGSRLCYRTRELAKYAGKQFEELYSEYFLLN